MNGDFTLPERRIYTVSQLTEQIKEALEESYPFVWISGEISDFRTPVSGHFYFTLRDPGAQISAVIPRPKQASQVFARGRHGSHRHGAVECL